MRRRLFVLFGLVAVLLVLAGIALTLIAPESSPLALLQRAADDTLCLQDDAGLCYSVPQVTGTNLNDEVVTFPDVFSEFEYVQVVIAFDEQQQLSVAEWLPLFTEREADPRVGFYSIAPLPSDIPALIRGAIVFGIRAGVPQPEVRDVIVVMFLDDQEAFVEAIGAEDNSSAQALIVDAAGTILYRDTGRFTEAKGAAYREALANLVDSQE